MRPRFLLLAICLGLLAPAAAFAADGDDGLSISSAPSTSSSSSAPSSSVLPSGPLTGYAGTNIELIHSGDRLRIEVYREEDLSGSFTVDSQGNINYPFLGEIFVEGLSLDELRAFLTESLGADYIVNPQIQITYEESPNKSVAILGMVNKPGNYILTANSTLVRVISQVGGFLPDANTENLRVVRTAKDGKKSSIVVNVQDVMSGEAEDFRLEPGDLVYVEKLPPPVEEEKKIAEEIVTIMGQVARPGNYVLSENLTLIRGIAQAGGFTAIASTHNVRLVRKGEDGRDRVRILNAARIMAGQAEDIPLEKGDLVVVQESFF